MNCLQTREQLNPTHPDCQHKECLERYLRDLDAQLEVGGGVDFDCNQGIIGERGLVLNLLRPSLV